jgi:hypothetical protein
VSRGLSRSAIIVAAVVGGTSSSCELQPDPNKHASGTTGAVTPEPQAPPKGSAAPDAAPPRDAAPPDAGVALDSGVAIELPEDGGPGKPPIDHQLEGRVLGRCAVQKRWSGHAFFHTEKTAFSVLVGTPNHWAWVNHSTPGPKFANQVEVPLDALVRATGVAGLTPSTQVLLVSGDATDQDLVGDPDDDKLNPLIYARQHAEAVEIVRVAHDAQSEGKPVIFSGPMPACIIHPPPGGHVTDHCTTPQCPR